MLAVTPAGAQSASTQQQLDELKKLIEQQQRVIEALQGQVAALKADSTATRETVDKTQQAVAETERKIPTGPLVTSAEPSIGSCSWSSVWLPTVCPRRMISRATSAC